MAYEDDNSSLDLTKFKEENATKNETSKSTVNKNKAQSLVFIPTHIENHTNMAGGKKLAYEDDKQSFEIVSQKNIETKFTFFIPFALFNGIKNGCEGFSMRNILVNS